MARKKGSKGPAAPKRPPLTHFLCIPLVNPASKTQLEKSLAQFREETTSSNPKVDREIKRANEGTEEVTSPTIPPKAVRPVGSLHCTLGVMSLDDDKLAKAVECLQGSDVRDLIGGMKSLSAESTTSPASKSPSSDASSTQLLIVTMKGLASMHSARQTSILYCPPEDPSGRLHPFCVALQQVFKDQGFLVEDNRPLKLHATVVNTIYAKGPRSAGHGPNAKAPLKIDATGLLDKYKDFVWAENVVLDRVAICEMGAKKIYDARGQEIGAEYTEVATVSLPT